jgi:hypothetical protein
MQEGRSQQRAAGAEHAGAGRSGPRSKRCPAGGPGFTGAERAVLPNRERRSLLAQEESEAPLQDLAQQMVSDQDIINHDRYSSTALVVSLQSRHLRLQGRREVIALAPGNPFARFFVGIAVAQLLFALLAAVVCLFLVPPTLAISLVLCVPSGRTLWAERVLEYYRTASTHGEALQRVALLGPKGMGGGLLISGA